MPNDYRCISLRAKMIDSYVLSIRHIRVLTADVGSYDGADRIQKKKRGIMKRPRLLVALGIAFIVAAVYAIRAGGDMILNEQLVYPLILALLSIYGLWGLVASRVPPDLPTSRMPRGVKVGIAAFSLTWGLMMFMAIVMLPFSGPAALRVLVGPWSPILLIIGAFLVVPFVQKRMH